VRMIKLNEVNPEKIYCPLCGTAVIPHPCCHVAALFVEGAYEGNGCQYLAEDVRRLCCSHLPEGFPRSMDDGSKLKYNSESFRRYKNNFPNFPLSFQEKESRTYERPVFTVVFREDFPITITLTDNL